MAPSPASQEVLHNPTSANETAVRRGSGSSSRLSGHKRPREPEQRRATPNGSCQEAESQAAKVMRGAKGAVLRNK